MSSLRWNGSVIGKRLGNAPAFVPSGAWNLQSQNSLISAGQWGGLGNINIRPRLWLDASDSSTLFDATVKGSTPAADGAVGRWEDKSGFGNHVAQATANNRPIRKTAQYNSLDVLDFDGSNDEFRTYLPWFNFATNNSYSAFTVGIADTVRTNSATVYLNDAFWGEMGGWTTNYLRSNNTVGVYNDPNAATVAYTAGALGIFGCELSGSSIRIRLNGGAETATATGNTSSNATSVLAIGRSFGALLDGKIGEVIFFDSALSAGNRQRVEGYLAHKWGLSGNLPNDHPYKNSAP
jgi:hypothetical protein